MIDYLDRLSKNRESGVEHAATAKPPRKRRSAAQKRATAKMLRANKRRRRGVKPKALTRRKKRASLSKGVTTKSPGKGKGRTKKASEGSMKRKKTRSKRRSTGGPLLRRTKAQRAATAKMIRANKRKRHKRNKSAVEPKRRRRRARKAVATKRRRKRRKSQASDWPGEPTRHAKAARKGWRKRRKSGGRRKARRTKAQHAAGRRNRRRAWARLRKARALARLRKAQAHRRGRRASAGHRSRSSRRSDYAAERHTRRKHGRRRSRRRGAMENPMGGAELFIGGVMGLVGFLTADALDRVIVTHALTVNPTPGANGVVRYIDTPPTTGNYPNIYNATAICAPMDWRRWLAGVAIAGVPISIAHFVKAPNGRAALQFFGFAAGVRIFGKGLIDLVAKVTSSNPIGQRLYDGEMRAMALHANNGATTGPGGDLSNLPSAGLGRPKSLGAAPDCAPCAEKQGTGYPSLPREIATAAAASGGAPHTTVVAPPPPPPAPPAAQPTPPGLFGPPATNGKPRNRFVWGDPD